MPNCEGTLTSVPEVHFIRVTTDDREHKFWAAAMPGEEAVQAVLDAIPEGWTVSLLTRATPDEIEALAIKPGKSESCRTPDLWISKPISTAILSPAYRRLSTILPTDCRTTRPGSPDR